MTQVELYALFHTVNIVHLYTQFITNHMKLTNYNRGYYEWCECSIHGTIYFTMKEWELVNKRKKYTENNPYLMSIITKKAIYLNLGVTETTRLVKDKDIKNFKRANYQIVISTSC